MKGALAVLLLALVGVWVITPEQLLHHAVKAFAKTRLPVIDGELKLAGLQSTVIVNRDIHGVPHIYADSLSDALMAQGFVHAQDRLFQMDLQRRAASGRLSALFGNVTVDVDRFTRTLDFVGHAEKDLHQLTEEQGVLMDAFVSGVNGYLQHESFKLPLEYTLLGLTPEPWTALDISSFARLMSWQMTAGWGSEIVRAEVIERVGAEVQREVESMYGITHPIITPLTFGDLHAENIPSYEGPPLSETLGSNSWVVSGTYTESGMPMIANDPHLVVGAPAVWYENHITVKDFGVSISGNSLPGCPLILIGHNGHISWGITLAYLDMEDIFIEKFSPNFPYKYEHEGKLLDAVVREYIVEVKGGETVKDVAVETIHGPVVSEFFGFEDQIAVLCSSSLRSDNNIDGLVKINLATNWKEFLDGTDEMESAALNFVYADTRGNIGYRTSGSPPIRKSGDGRMIQPGWTGEADWIGVVAQDDMPRFLNPEEGFIVTANNRVVSEDHVPYLGAMYSPGDRAKRVTDRLSELIASGVKLTVSHMMDIQRDLVSLPVLELRELLFMEAPTPEETFEGVDDVRLALSILEKWDGEMRADSFPAAVAEAARYFVCLGVLKPTLGDRLAYLQMGGGIHPLKNSNEFLRYETSTVTRLLRGHTDATPSHFVTRAGGRTKVVRDGMIAAIAYLRENYGPDMAGWEWGRLHECRFKHPLGRQWPLNHVFDIGPFPLSGTQDTVQQTAYVVTTPFTNVGSWGISCKMVIDMADVDRHAYMTVPPGQSGSLGSQWYDDQATQFEHGEYHRMYRTATDVADHSHAILVLRP